jgi:hypothetical protein
MASVPFNNLITFSRGSNATLTGSKGLIQWAPNNLVTFSEQFNNAAWAKNSSSIAANSVSAPDGTRTADTWTPTSNGIASSVRLLGTFTLPVGPTATTSIYVKSAGKRWVYMTTPAASSALHNCWFDLQTGTVGTQGSAVLAATMTAVGDGWYRISATSTTTAATNYVFLSATDADNSLTVVADGTGVFIWGAQLELGSTATTYNSTTVKNLVGYSESFDNAAWTKTRASIVTGAQANPVNGAFNAQKLMEDTSAVSSHRVNSGTVTVATNSVVTVSVYLKAAERTWCRIADGGVTSSGAYVNLATGQFGTIASGVTRSSIVSVGNGWYRASITGVLASNLSQLFIDLADGDNVLTYTGNGNSGIYIYGAQISDSASLDPYVPTPGAAPSSTAYYGPRFDYDPVTLAPKGILVEEARTNLILYSEQFDNAAYVKNLVTVTANTTTSPDGTVNADTLSETATSGEHFIPQQIAKAASNITYTQTAYFKNASGARNFGMSITDGTTGGYGAIFSTTGTVVSASFAVGVTTGWTFVSSGVTPVGNGWYRASLTVTSNTSTRLDSVYYLIDGTTRSYLGSAGNSIFIYGAQLEAGAFPTSYIPTVASTVTRSADVATITGSLFSQWYAQSEGSFVAIFTAAQNTFTTYIAASNGVVAQNSMHMDNDGSGNMRVAYYSGSSAVALLSLGATGTVGTVNILGTAYRANDFAASRNGGTVVSDTAGAVPVGVNRLNIGADSSGAAVNVSNGHIRYAAYYPVRLADFQLQALTELPLVPTLDLDFLNNLYEA